MDRPLGITWLQQQFQLYSYPVTHTAYLGPRAKVEVDEEGCVAEIYVQQYAPAENTPLAHLAFALKYDDLQLDFSNSQDV